MPQLEFDESLVNDLKVLYRRRDILRRRRLVHEALDARPGERVLDIGLAPASTPPNYSNASVRQARLLASTLLRRCWASRRDGPSTTRM
jgi:hypothetical protein